MKITDAAVYPHPAGDTSVRRMALEARTLGFDSLVVIDTPSGHCEGMEIYSGVSIRDTTMRDVIARVKRAKDAGAVVSVCARDNGFNRAVIGLKGVHILRGIQAAGRDAFDHVTAKMAAENNVAVDIDLSPLISGRGVFRQRAIHRYRDLLSFRNRYRFPITISTGARSCLQLRGVREITGLTSLIGMDVDDVAAALGGVGMVTTPPAPVVREIP